MKAAHPLVVEAAAIGITIAADGDGLLVKPASRLTSELRARLVAAKLEVLSVLTANDATAGPCCDPARWARFRNACLGLGVTLDELDRHFPTVEDREDIVQTPDIDIVPCARTIVVAILRNRSAAIATHAPPTVGRTVQCAECLHFIQPAVAVGYGRCAAGVPSTGATVLHFATHRHLCGKFGKLSS